MNSLLTVLTFGLFFGLAFAVISRLLKSRWGRVLFVIGCVITAAALLADVISGIFGYRSFYTDIRDTGFITNRYAMKAIAITLALICYLAVGEMMRNIAHGRVRRAIFWGVGWMLIYWSAMFGFSGKQLFGCEGGPCYSYDVLENGQIILRDIGLVNTPDPETGRPLKALTPEVAEQYRRQQKMEAPSPSLWNRLFGNDSLPDTELQMSIEGVEIFADRTILHFAVKRTRNSVPGRFYQPQGCYLSDETGQTYDLVKDNATYGDLVDAETHKEELTSGKTATTRAVRPDETYRFTDEYPPLKTGIYKLRLHDSRFAQVDLDDKIPVARITYLELSAEATPKNGRILNDLFDLYAGSGLYNRAIPFYRSMLKLNPKNVIASANLGRAYYLNEQFDEALAQIDYTLTLNPKDTVSWYNQGIFRAYGKKDLPGAAESFYKVLEMDPMGKNGRDAKKKIEELKLQKPSRPTNPPVKAKIVPKSPVAALKRSKQPNNPPPKLPSRTVAVTPMAPPTVTITPWESTNRIIELEQKVQANPQDCKIQGDLAQLYITSKLFNEGIKFYLRIILTDHKAFCADFFLARMYYETSQYDLALAALDVYLTAHPQSLAALYTQGLYKAHGKEDMAGAAESWQKVLAMDPNGELGMKARKELETHGLPLPIGNPAEK